MAMQGAGDVLVVAHEGLGFAADDLGERLVVGAAFQGLSDEKVANIIGSEAAGYFSPAKRMLPGG